MSDSVGDIVKQILLVAYILFLVAFGSYCVFSPKAVQAKAVKAMSTGVT